MLAKSDLLTAIASKNRGILATAADQTAIAALVATLEDQNPTANPVETPSC